MTYCVYLTIYHGNRLPPFYIGSTSIENVKSGYHGSVTKRSSKRYGAIWEEELLNNPDLFSTKVVSEYTTRDEAYDAEFRLQTALKVLRNPLYVNCTIANKNFRTFGPMTEERKRNISLAKKGVPNLKNRGRVISQEHREAVSRGNKGRKRSEEFKANVSAKNTGRKRSEETKRRISEALKNRTFSDEHRRRISEKCTDRPRSGGRFI